MQPSHHATSQKSAPATGGVDMTADEFERVAARVLQMAGIVLGPHRRQMLVSRLSRRLRAREVAIAFAVNVEIARLACRVRRRVR